jgi:hypothetical protein
MERVRMATIAFCVFLLFEIIRAVRREHIRVEYSMAWFGAAVLLMTLALSDTVLNWIGRMLGVSNAPSALGLVAGLVFVFIFFWFSIQMSGLKDHNIVLAQKVGLLEWEIKKQAKEIDNLKKGDPVQRAQRESAGGKG